MALKAQKKITRKVLIFSDKKDCLTTNSGRNVLILCFFELEAKIKAIDTHSIEIFTKNTVSKVIIVS